MFWPNYITLNNKNKTALDIYLAMVSMYKENRKPSDQKAELQVYDLDKNRRLSFVWSRHAQKYFCELLCFFDWERIQVCSFSFVVSNRKIRAAWRYLQKKIPKLHDTLQKVIDFYQVKEKWTNELSE